MRLYCVTHFDSLSDCDCLDRHVYLTRDAAERRARRLEEQGTFGGVRTRAFVHELEACWETEEEE